MNLNLTKDNYKEIEYAINSYIKERKILFIEQFPKKLYGIDMSFAYNGIMSTYTAVDFVEIQEWNNGIKVEVFLNGSSSSFYYREDESTYASVSIGMCGGGKCLSNNTWYYSDWIRFYTA